VEDKPPMFVEPLHDDPGHRFVTFEAELSTMNGRSFLLGTLPTPEAMP